MEFLGSKKSLPIFYSIDICILAIGYDVRAYDVDNMISFPIPLSSFVPSSRLSIFRFHRRSVGRVLAGAAKGDADGFAGDEGDARIQRRANQVGNVQTPGRNGQDTAASRGAAPRGAIQASEVSALCRCRFRRPYDSLNVARVVES